MMGWYDNGAGVGGWAVMGLMMLFWTIAVGVAVWAGLRLLRGDGGRATVSPTPRSVLDTRLASGEIDAEQYAGLRRLLDGQSVGRVSSDHPRTDGK